jgi:uncharacterized membrane-anchored protein
MKPAYRGIAVAVVQCLLTLSVFGKYAIDRERLPRVWAKAAPVDPNLPLRGRYLAIRLEVEAAPAQSVGGTGHLSIRDGRLFVERDDAPFDASTHVRIMRNTANRWTLIEPVAFFLPEHAADPSRLAADKELWVEVSVPRKGPPRPIRLEVR